MNLRILVCATVVLLAVPWIPAFLSHGTVGMQADPRHVLFQGDSDVYDCIWHGSWIRQSLNRGTDPRNYHGRTLAWNNMGWPDLFLSWLLGTGYQGMLMLGSLFTFAAGYFLARSWGLGREASLVAALIITWMPVRLVRVYQHYSIGSICYTLMALASVRRYLEKPETSFLVMGFIFSLLAVSESLQHGITIACGWLLTVVFSRWNGKRRALISGVVPALGCIAGALWLLTAPGLSGIDPGKDWREAVFWGAELQSYFLPSMLGNPTVTGYMPNPFEGVVSPGLSVMALAIAWCVWKKNWKPAAAALVIMVVSVGPLLKWNGVPTSLPLPYIIPAKLPFLSAARAPSRLAVLVGIMASLAASSFVTSRKGILPWILTAVVALEIVPFSMKKIEDTVPSFYSVNAPEELRLEIPASSAIRYYSLLESADGAERRVKFFARGGEDMERTLPGGLLWRPPVAPERNDLLLTEADVVVYNRWLFSDSLRVFYDSLYRDVFLPSEKGDSLWIWMRHENGS